ncbi:hypothetical protein ACFLZZ_01995 [Nanoarchaeota archaeon]
MSGGSCRDLRQYQKEGVITDAFSKLVSGNRAGYKTVIEKKTELPKLCKGCSLEMNGTENFCPECGAKTPKRLAWEEKNRVIPKEELEQLFKEQKKGEGETLTHLRDKLKMDQLEAFELIQKWRKDLNPPQQTTNPRNLFN